MARARLLCGSRLMLLALIMGVLMAGSTRTAAQEGDKTVWAQSGASTVLAASTIWVDATSFCGTGGGTNNCNGASFDFCTVVSKALTQLLSVSPAGGVVDARGVLPFGAGTEPCSSDPFVPLETLSLNPPVTILLPAYNIELNPTSGAGSGTWVLPNNVRLVGTGFQTVLLGAATCCYTAGYLIDMGSLTCSTGYTGIGIEHLQVVTQALATTPSTYYGGIDNECAGEGSYVSDVKISGNPSTPTALGAVGLMIGAGAVNSGPYTDIYVVAAPGNTCGSSYPSNVSCVSVLTQTRGIHGISCLGSEATGASSVSAGILVNASNNSIEDVHVESFYDGVALNDTSLGAINNIFVSNVDRKSVV